MVEGCHADWSECDGEVSAGEVSGLAVPIGTRGPVQMFVDNLDNGLIPAQIAEQQDPSLSDVIIQDS